jgi:EmrB/QacA subfamily drug resistance transporter
VPSDTAVPDVAAPMTRRQTLEALSGLLMGMFVALLSSTVVSSSLPRIIGDLGGTQASYTWVVTSTMLAMAVSTPIWGKLADLFNRKLLVQLSLVLFVIGSALAGLSQDSGMLIVFRVVQGLGAGGLTALVQVVMADIISPRERGKYMGFMGAVMAVATVGGPLLGGVITDSIGWRWNFYVAVPFAVIALVLLQKTLHLPTKRRRVTIDYLGAGLIAAGVSSILIWVTLAGHTFAWWSWETVAMVGGGIAVLVLAVVVELRAEEPVLPLNLFKDRTFSLAVVASLAVGVAMFGTSVFLSQYMQLARGKTPTESGLLTIPMIGGVLIASTIAGQFISRTGKWKAWLVTGSFMVAVGLALMGTIRFDTSFLLVSLYMLVLGAGVGMVMQNLVLIVQNSVDVRQLGAASAGVAFFRTLGGTIGVSALGAVLGTAVATYTKEGIPALDPASQQAAGALAGGSIPHLSTLPEPLRLLVESAYGHGTGDIFLYAVPLAIITILCVAFLPNRPLGTKTAVEQLQEQGAPAGAVDGVPAQPETAGERFAERLVETAADEGAAVPTVHDGEAAGRHTGPEQDERVGAGPGGRHRRS